MFKFLQRFILQGLSERMFRMSVIVKIIEMALKQMSPEIKAEIVKWLKEAKIKASQTSNPWDDILIDFLLFLVGESS